MNKFKQFLIYDEEARERAMRISMIIAFVSGPLIELIYGVRFAVAAYSAVIVMCISYSIQIWRYCNDGIASVASSDRPISRRLAMAIPAVVIAALLNIVPLGVAEAAILDRRLRNLLRDPVLTENDAKELGEALSLGLQRGPHPSRGIILQVRNKVTEALVDYPPSREISNTANVLVKYDTTPNPLLQAELEIATEHYVRARALATPSTHGSDLNPAEAAEALAALNRAFDLAGNDAAMKSHVLLRRAMLYNDMERHDEALADADEAYRLGSLDLSTILTVKGNALLGRGADRRQPLDLELAIKYFTASIQLDPPMWTLSRPAIISGVRAEQYLQRAEAFYYLNNFSAALEDVRMSLSMGAFDSDLAQGYLLAIRSDLRLRRVEDALGTAREWATRTHTLEAARALGILEDNQSNPGLAFNLLMHQ